MQSEYYVKVGYSVSLPLVDTKVSQLVYTSKLYNTHNGHLSNGDTTIWIHGVGLLGRMPYV